MAKTTLVRRSRVTGGPTFRPGRRVPRAIDKWFASLFVTSEWHDTDDAQWVRDLRRIAQSEGCTVVFDLDHGYQESCLILRGRAGPRLILLGAAGGTKDDCITAFLHELGHAVVYMRGQQSKDSVAAELAAWNAAQALAQEHGLPVLSENRRRALYTYRYADLLRGSRGSKGSTQTKRASHYERLLESKASAAISGGEEKPAEEMPRGKKGKRLAKRAFKRRSARVRRRTSTDES